MMLTLLLLCLGAHAASVVQHATLCQKTQAEVCDVTSGAVCDMPGPSFPVGQCVNEPVVGKPADLPYASWHFVEVVRVHGGSLEYGLALYVNASCAGAPTTGTVCTQGACCKFATFPFDDLSVNGTLYSGFVAGVPPQAPYSTPMIVGLVLGLGIPILSLIVIAVYYCRRRRGYDHVKQVDDDLM